LRNTKQNKLVRHKAKVVLELLHDEGKLREERRKAKENRGKYQGYGSDARVGMAGTFGAFYLFEYALIISIKIFMNVNVNAIMMLVLHRLLKEEQEARAHVQLPRERLLNLFLTRTRRMKSEWKITILMTNL
jgi:hypothetical protein